MTLLFEAFSVYLDPLLEKHAAGKVLVWEDLTSSHAALTNFMQSHDNVFVAKRAENMHRLQVKAYKDAAAQSLKEWAQSAPLEPMEDTDTEDTFVERCVSAACSSAPNWKITIETAVGPEIRARAKAAFAKYHPTDESLEDGEEDEDGEVGEEGEEEEGEEAGGDEAEDEDGEVVSDEKMGDSAAEESGPSKTTTTTTTATAKAVKKAPAAGNKNKKGAAKGNVNNKATARKKATATKASAPNTRTQGGRGKGGAARGRRGRSAGTAASKSS